MDERQYRLPLFFIFLLTSPCMAIDYIEDIVYYMNARDLPYQTATIEESGSTFETGSLEELNYGVATVKIPMLTTKMTNHTLTSATLSIGVIIESMQDMKNDYNKFLDNINEEYFSSTNEDNISSLVGDTFIFIHGYFTTFEYAIQKTAQLKHDLQILGPCIAYVWYSQGTLTGYTADEEAVENTIPYCKNSIKLCIAKIKGKRLHILAHSMGNRALIGASKLMYSESGIMEWIREGMHFKSMILAAADVQRERFEDMFKVMKEVHVEAREEERMPHMTVYTALDDLPLLVSTQINQENCLGLTSSHFEEDAITLKENPTTSLIDVVDSTGSGNDISSRTTIDVLMRHFYFSNNLRCLKDIHMLMLSPPPLDHAWYRASNKGGTISSVSYAKTYHFFSTYPNYWIDGLIIDDSKDSVANETNAS